MKSSINALFINTLLFSGSSLAQASLPFSECPSRAFLIQDNVAKVFGVNLATGSYELLEDSMGTQGKLNATGFNPHDYFIYGYSNEFQAPVRIDSGFQVEPLAVVGFPNTNFYVGDISLQANTYYLYHPNNSIGLYKISLDPESSDYLVATQVINGSGLKLSIFDFAFHPEDHQLYSVDRNGFLHKTNPEMGTSENLGNVGESGTFGAAYFDGDNNFYISRNSDGNIFRIDVGDVNPSAEFFAYGPSSSNNDGARCAAASIVSDVATIDFGSAPTSYGSNLENNGARHEQKEGFQLGNVWSGENDGVEFVTEFEVGADAILTLDVKGEGIVNAWADWDNSGEFDSNEQVVADQAVTEGVNLVVLSIPEQAKAGETWTRIRYSSQQGIGVNGGVADGEVEDQLVQVLDSGVSVQSFPSTASFATLAFEDNWPELGDYDMNDVVIAMRTHVYRNAQQQVIRYDIEGKVLALGASYHNGFAVQLDGIKRSEIDETRAVLYVNGFDTLRNPVEQNNLDSDAVIVFFDDLKEELIDGSCQYYRTEIDCSNFEGTREVTFRATVTLAVPIDALIAPTEILNPFVFATPGFYHGPSFATPPGRALEIHLKNKPPSVRFNTDFFGLADDDSLAGSGLFVSANAIPWALQVPVLWAHPKERVDITRAYPNFVSFVKSEGAEAATWYQANEADSTSIINNSWEL